jgi:hypothetical protein
MTCGLHLLCMLCIPGSCLGHHAHVWCTHISTHTSAVGVLQVACAQDCRGTLTISHSKQVHHVHAVAVPCRHAHVSYMLHVCDCHVQHATSAPHLLLHMWAHMMRAHASCTICPHRVGAPTRVFAHHCMEHGLTVSDAAQAV